MAVAGFLMKSCGARWLTPVLPFRSERESLVPDTQWDDKSSVLPRLSPSFPLPSTPPVHLFGNKTHTSPGNSWPCGILHPTHTKQNPLPLREKR